MPTYRIQFSATCQLTPEEKRECLKILVQLYNSSLWHPGYFVTQAPQLDGHEHLKWFFEHEMEGRERLIASALAFTLDEYLGITRKIITSEHFTDDDFEVMIVSSV